MSLSKRTVCHNCTAELEIEADEDFPILFCASCGNELEEDDELEDHDDE